jgi:arsenate reductase (glutaredoxin)
MQVTIHGIRNCDTMKKARAWLDARQVAYRFHDYKIQGLAPALLDRWCAVLGWEALLNRSGTTFRKLSPAEREPLDAARARALMLAAPSMVRRPVLEVEGRVVVGFDPDAWERLLG